MTTETTLFICYAHADMEPIHWLNRLTDYLAPLQKSNVKVWEDSQIEAGYRWDTVIKNKLKAVDIAILLVGPEFFKSTYIIKKELPFLLEAFDAGKISILPLVVTECNFKRRRLGALQAFNKPETPLAALSETDQCEMLNKLSKAVDELVRRRSASANGRGDSESRNRKRGAVIKLQRSRSDAFKAFEAQDDRRVTLARLICERLHVRVDQYERFFARHYVGMTAEEQFEFDQIRALTEGPMHDANNASRDLLLKEEWMLDEMPVLVDMQQHLVFWLNKYERVFKNTPSMCLLYTGVEDGVPFPRGADPAIAKWLEENPAS